MVNLSMMVSFCRNKYCVLIVAFPKRSEAIYLDSERHHKKKDYRPIKSVLDEALTGYTFHGCLVENQYVREGKPVFGHKTDFKSVTQLESSKLDAFYVLMLIQEYVRDMQQLQLPGQLRTWCLKNMTDATDSQHRLQFVRIQHTIATTIYNDVLRKEGLFYYGSPPANADVERRSEDQGDYRPFNTLNGTDPFPPLPKKKASKKKQ